MIFSVNVFVVKSQLKCDKNNLPHNRLYRCLQDLQARFCNIAISIPEFDIGAKHENGNIIRHLRTSTLTLKYVITEKNKNIAKHVAGALILL